MKQTVQVGDYVSWRDTYHNRLVGRVVSLTPTGFPRVLNRHRTLFTLRQYHMATEADYREFVRLVDLQNHNRWLLTAMDQIGRKGGSPDQIASELVSACVDYLRRKDVG